MEKTSALEKYEIPSFACSFYFFFYIWLPF